jgi:outer membrane PBP1 activator LpoA protein
MAPRWFEHPRLARLIGFALCLTASALSAQERKPASAPPVPIAQTPTPNGPDAKSEAPAEAKAKTPPKPQPHVALILPLQSKAFGKVADAIQQGFIAASKAAGKETLPFRVAAADDDTVALAREARRSVSEAAVLIVGGITRDGANTLAREVGYVPVLSLNTPSMSETELPDRYHFVSLNLDSEARLAARRAGDEGLKRIVIASTPSALSKRIQDSFEKEWQKRGGEIASRILINGDLVEGDRIVAAFEKAQADSAFLVAEKKVARGARPFFPQGLPVYSTSYTIDPRAGPVENLDLDGVRFMEMPWFVEADHPAVMAYDKPSETMPIDFERLYALGIDAWRLATAIVNGDPKKPFPPLDGVTGKISLEGKQFVRALIAAELRDGRVTARSTE